MAGTAAFTSTRVKSWPQYSFRPLSITWQGSPFPFPSAATSRAASAFMSHMVSSTTSHRSKAQLLNRWNTRLSPPPTSTGAGSTVSSTR